MEVYSANRENQVFGRRAEKTLHRPVKPFQVNSENAPPGKNKSVRKSNRRALGDISNDGISLSRTRSVNSLKPERSALSNISNAKKPVKSKPKISVHAAKPFQIDADTVETRERESAKDHPLGIAEIDIDELLNMPMLEEEEEEMPTTLAIEPVELDINHSDEFELELEKETFNGLGSLDIGPNDLVIDDLLLNTEFSFE